MKLLLASLASDTLSLVIPLLTDHPRRLKAAFIATAADPYEGEDTPWLTAEHDKLLSFGFKVTDYDLKGKTEDELRSDLSDFHLIYVSGGNTFYLLNEMKKSGFDRVIKDLLNQGIIYVGSSAGSIVLGPDLNHLVTVDHPEVVKDLKIYDSLNLIKLRLLPHYGRDKYAARHAKILKHWGNNVLPLKDNQALIVNGDTINIVTFKQ
jgi:dipeptidase E